MLPEILYCHNDAMLIRILTCRFSSELQGFPDDALRSFCANHRVLEVSEQFFVHQGVPHWSFVIDYDPLGDAQADTHKDSREQDWRNLLSKEQMPCFEALRAWRNEKAREKGISAYIIGTNRMLAEVVARRPASLEELRDVPGFGPAKIKDYGKGLLELLNSSMTATEKPASEDDGKE